MGYVEFMYTYPLVPLIIIGIILIFARHLQHKRKRNIVLWYGGPLSLLVATGIAVPNTWWAGASWQAPLMIAIMYVCFILIVEGNRAKKRRENRK